MNSPKISIVIPSYNKVKYIELTLKSIFDQSYKNFEVIIQDGGSTDGTFEVIKKYAKKYPSFIKYESKKDGGQLDAINKGIKKATGEILTFINADDEYTKGSFESVAGHYTENPEASWFAGKGIIVDEKGKKIAQTVSFYKNFLLFRNFYTILLSNNYLIQPSVFLSKSVFAKYGLFTGIKFAVMEYDMWLKIGKDSMPIVINKVLSKFRMEKDTKTTKNSEILLNEDEKIVRKYTKNIFILFIHKLNNIGRRIVLNIISTI